MAQNDQPDSGTFFSKLLVAIDGSEISDYALNFAIHIGENFSSKIDLIYVYAEMAPAAIATPLYDPMSGPILSPQPQFPATDKAIHRIVSKNEALVHERKKLVEGRGIACEALSIESDNIEGEILKRGNNYDLIVLGSRGLSGLQSLLLGSVSGKVAKEAKRSVLVVKNKIDRLPKILLAYDGSNEAKAALEAAAAIGSKFGAQVDSIGVVSIPVLPEGMVIPENIGEWEKEMSGYVQEGTKLLNGKGITNSTGKVLDATDVSKAITDEAARGAYDLIVVGNRGYGRLKSFFLGSVAAGVADNSKTNVLIVR